MVTAITFKENREIIFLTLYTSVLFELIITRYYVIKNNKVKLLLSARKYGKPLVIAPF